MGGYDAVATRGTSRVDSYRLPVGEPDPILHLYLCEENVSPLRPKAGLSPSSVYQAHYLTPQEPRPASFALVQGPVDDGTCGFWEIDRRLMPGLYGLQVPASVRSVGYTYVRVSFAGAYPHYLVLHGVDFDPYDRDRLGLVTWIRTTGHDHLSTGLRRSMPSTLRPLLEEWFERRQ